MGRRIDYAVAQEVLDQEFANAELDYAAGNPIGVPVAFSEAIELLFRSRTQAYREALVGCALARIVDNVIDLTLPYMNQGANAFSGRMLDERVVNPFLHDRTIPCSRAPYLSSLRRNISFVAETARGLQDVPAFNAMLAAIALLQVANEQTAREYLRFVLYHFLRLREAAQVNLARINRLSLEQYDVLIDSLLAVPSGGLMPVLLSVAMFQTLNTSFARNWNIQWQGINVADRAAGAGGDITISVAQQTILAVEVTERTIDRARVVSTFTTKILPHAIEDYLFLFSMALPTPDARTTAQQYFAQGHEIGFLPVKLWIVNCLGIVGAQNRRVFIDNLLALLAAPDVPAALKVGWNDCLRNLLETGV